MTETNNITFSVPLQGTDMKLFNRFMKYVDKTTSQESCWLWTGVKNIHGYGMFWVNGKYIGSHRVVYELYVKPIPKDKFILHTCDNPACVSPYHLYADTHQKNMEDRNTRNRQAKGEKHGLKAHPEKAAKGETHGSKTCPETTNKGSKNGSSKLTEEKVVEIITLFSTGEYSTVSLAEKYNVSHVLISGIVNNKIWKHVKSAEAPDEKVKTISRLNKYTDKTTSDKGCWLWTGTTLPNGYGQIWFQGKATYVHRVAYLTFIGAIPENKDILHTCNAKICINPEHLFLKDK